MDQFGDSCSICEHLYLMSGPFYSECNTLDVSGTFSVEKWCALCQCFIQHPICSHNHLTSRSICNGSGAQFKLKNSLYETFYGWKVLSPEKTLELLSSKSVWCSFINDDALQLRFSKQWVESSGVTCHKNRLSEGLPVYIVHKRDRRKGCALDSKYVEKLQHVWSLKALGSK